MPNFWFFYFSKLLLEPFFLKDIVHKNTIYYFFDLNLYFFRSKYEMLNKFSFYFSSGVVPSRVCQIGLLSAYSDRLPICREPNFPIFRVDIFSFRFSLRKFGLIPVYVYGSLGDLCVPWDLAHGRIFKNFFVKLSVLGR